MRKIEQGPIEARWSRSVPWTALWRTRLERDPVSCQTSRILEKWHYCMEERICGLEMGIPWFLHDRCHGARGNGGRRLVRTPAEGNPCRRSGCGSTDGAYNDVDSVFTNRIIVGGKLPTRTAYRFQPMLGDLTPASAVSDSGGTTTRRTFGRKTWAVYETKYSRGWTIAYADGATPPVALSAATIARWPAPIRGFPDHRAVERKV